MATLPSLAELRDANYRLRLRAVRELAATRIVNAYARVAAAERGTERKLVITPDMARRFLANRAPNQPPVDIEKVARYAADMREGRWRG